MDFDALDHFLSRQRAIRLFDTSRPVGDDLVEKALRSARDLADRLAGP
jgi:nitroreductase